MRGPAYEASMAVAPVIPLEEYAALVEEAPVMLWRAGADGRRDYFNAAWLSFTGRTLARAEGDGWVECAHPDDVERCAAAWRASLERRAPFECAYRMRGADGAYHHVVDRAVPRRDARGEFAGYVGRCDVDDERYRKAAFLSTMAHELRTPLSSLALLAQSMLRKSSSGAPPQPEALERLMRQTRRMNALIEDLSTAGRLEAGRGLTIDHARVDLVAVVDEALAARRDLWPNDAPAIEREAPAGPRYVAADRRRLARAVLALIDNAVRYSPEGGAVRVAVRDAPAGVEVAVSDQGIGVPRDELARLGTRYYRASNAPAVHPRGLGLGLALAREIAELHGGRLTIESEPGRGATATLSLPLAREA